jgi:inorganic pyrophosphatase
LSVDVAKRESLRTELVELTARLPEIRSMVGNPLFYSNPEHLDESRAHFTGYSSHSVVLPTLLELRRLTAEINRIVAQISPDNEGMSVFVQNQAGSDQKNHHDEKRLRWRHAVQVSRAYPFPYGFIPGTMAEDGCSVDCFVLTKQPLRMGDIVSCEPIGLMEQVEDAEIDHNILACRPGEQLVVTNEMRDVLTDFVHHVFDHIPGKRIRVGRFLGRDAAKAHLRSHRHPN